MRLRIFMTLVVALGALGAITGAALAQEGVGVNVGSIEVDEPIAPGGTYRLPSIGVINTGHDPGTYSLRITYLSGQPEMEPAEDWFRFSPDLFVLEPDEAQSVIVSIQLPLTARPGDYFAFVEAFPVRETEEGVGPASASRQPRSSASPWSSPTSSTPRRCGFITVSRTLARSPISASGCWRLRWRRSCSSEWAGFVFASAWNAASGSSGCGRGPYGCLVSALWRWWQRSCRSHPRRQITAPAPVRCKRRCASFR